MIVRHEDTRTLLDREALAVLTGRSKNTIRARLVPAVYDEKGRPLYVMDEAVSQLRAIPTRLRRVS